MQKCKFWKNVYYLENGLYKKCTACNLHTSPLPPASCCWVEPNPAVKRRQGCLPICTHTVNPPAEKCRTGCIPKPLLSCDKKYAPPSHFGISILGCSPSHQQAGLYPLCPWERKTKKFLFPMWEFSNNFFYMGMTTGNSFWWGKSKLLQTWRLCFAFQYECYAGKQWRFPYKSPLGSGDKLIRLGDEETLKQEKGATQNTISIQAPDCHSQTQKNAYSLHPRHKLYTKKNTTYLPKS